MIYFRIKNLAKQNKKKLLRKNEYPGLHIEVLFFGIRNVGRFVNFEIVTCH